MAWGQCCKLKDLLLPQATSWMKPHLLSQITSEA